MRMFGKMKSAPVPTYDVTQKIKKTWWGGTKLIPTTKSEQRKRKAEILKQIPMPSFWTVRQKKEKERNGSTALRILMLLCEKENLGRYSNFLPRNCHDG